MAANAVTTLEDRVPAAPRKIPHWETELVSDILNEFNQYVTWRNVFAMQWEEAVRLIWPEQRNTFYYGTWNWPGQKKTDEQVDASGMLALERFTAIIDSLLTPANSEWHGLEADNDYLMKNRDIRLWFDQLTQILFKLRNNPLSNFRAQNSQVWKSLGCLGNATMYVDALDARMFGGTRGLRYKAVALGETFFGENHQGQVDRLPSDFIMHILAEAWRGEDADDEPQGEPRDLGRPAASVMILDELQAG